MEALFGASIADLRYYWLRKINLDGIPLIVSRTGWSSELGYEIFLCDNTKGSELWEKIMNAGASFDLKPGHTSSIRRIEGGMLSYHADMDIHTNPFELGLDRLVELDTNLHFIGKAALKNIKRNGIKRKQVGIEISGLPLKGPNTRFWSLEKNGKIVGKVTSAVHSPRLKKNIALAMVDLEHTTMSTALEVITPESNLRAKVVEKPFFDPRKTTARS